MKNTPQPVFDNPNFDEAADDYKTRNADLV